MFRRRATVPDDARAKLVSLVRASMVDADADTVEIVAAIAGLLGAVSYADRDCSETETERVGELLQSVDGIGAYGAAAIVNALRSNIIEIATVQQPRFCRTLVELADRELRVQILGMLVEVAAADHVITDDEVKVLRQVTTSLGLPQDDYNALQSVHRDKLSALNR